jgi:hypothetical protein
LTESRKARRQISGPRCRSFFIGSGFAFILHRSNSPPQAGPPFVENVPTTIRSDGSQLLVTLLSGAPFIGGLSQVRQIDPIAGANNGLIDGPSAAADVIPLEPTGHAGIALNALNNPAPPVPCRWRFLFVPIGCEVFLRGFHRQIRMTG